MNESRAVLLSFCALDCLSIMNTCFEKNELMCLNTPSNILAVSCGTSYINYILMRECQRKFCHDVFALHKLADCRMNHKLLRAKLSKLFLTCDCHIPG